MTAFDKDLGARGDLTYSLYEGEDIPALAYFDIDPQTGEVTVKSDLTLKGELKLNERFMFLGLK